MKTPLTLLLLFSSFWALAQKSDSTHTHFRIIRGGFIEHSTELKSKPNIKNGLAEIKGNRKKVASGAYKDGEQTGRWYFYKFSDSSDVDQIYNYDTREAEFNAPHDNITCQIEGIRSGDKITNPYKIGGYDYGMNFIWKQFKMPKELGLYPGKHPLYLTLSIDSSGKLTNCEIKIASSSYNNTSTMDLSKLKPFDLEFGAAKVNGTAVNSKLIIREDITIN